MTLFLESPIERESTEKSFFFPPIWMLRIHSSVRMVMCPKGAFTLGLQYIQSHIAINDAFLMFAGLEKHKACNAGPWQISELKERGNSVRSV